METFLREVGWALRNLRNSPGFTVIATITLALGIGASSAVFSLVNGVLLKPLPYPDAEQLVVFHHTAPGIGLPRLPLSERDLVNYKKVVRAVSSLGLYLEQDVDLTGEGQAERLLGVRVTGGVFATLGVPPALGRTLLESDEDPSVAPVIVISHALWAERFGSDPRVIGSSIRVAGETREIVGVMPRGFAFPDESTEVWLPATIDPAAPSFDHVYTGVARARPGVGPELIRADFQAAIDNLSVVYPEVFSPAFLERARFAPVIRTLRESVVGEVSGSLWILLGTVGFVLLIACANVANLFLVRAEGSLQERAVREALGASWVDLARLHLAESLVLVVGAGVAGLAMGTAALRLATDMAPASLPRLGQVGLDVNVLAFNAALTVSAAAFFGFVPLLRHLGPDVASLLGEGHGQPGSRARRRLRNVLVIAQVAIALVLLVGAGLMVRSFWSIRKVDPGFDPGGILTARLSLREGTYPTQVSVAAFFQDLLEEVRALPAVESASAVSRVPLGPEAIINYAFQLEDFPPAPGDPPSRTNAKVVAPEYFTTMGIELVEGRAIERVDHEAPTNSIVVNRAMAKRFWGEDSPLGRRLRHGPAGDWLSVVGVVESVRDRSLTNPPESLVYLPMVDTPGAFTDDPRAMTVVVRTPDDPTTLVEPLKRLAWSIDTNVPFADVLALDQIVATSSKRTSFTMLVLGTAAAMALVLGAVGLYGVVAWVVSQRTREIGVRIALGAEAQRVRWLFLRQGLSLALAGIGLGLLGASAVSRLLESFLFGVAAFDPSTYGAMAALLLAVAFVASYAPARRASRLDPIVAIRGG